MLLVHLFGLVVIVFGFFLVVFLVGGRAKRNSCLGKIYQCTFGSKTAFGKCCHWIFYERNPLMIVCFFFILFYNNVFSLFSFIYFQHLFQKLLQKLFQTLIYFCWKTNEINETMKRWNEIEKYKNKKIIKCVKRIKIENIK